MRGGYILFFAESCTYTLRVLEELLDAIGYTRVLWSPHRCKVATEYRASWLETQCILGEHVAAAWVVLTSFELRALEVKSLQHDSKHRSTRPV